MDPTGENESNFDSKAAQSGTLKAIIRTHIVEALRKTGGKIYGNDGAAQLLGLKPSTLQAKLKRLGLDRKDLPK